LDFHATIVHRHGRTCNRGAKLLGLTLPQRMFGVLGFAVNNFAGISEEHRLWALASA